MSISVRKCALPALSKHDPQVVREPRLRAEAGFVYFIRMGTDGPIKIGWSMEPQARLETLQTSSPVTLSLLAVADGSKADERRTHKRLSAHRLRGEWFKDCAELRKAMVDLGATPYRAQGPTTRRGENCLNCRTLLVVDEDVLCKACVEFMDDWASPEFIAHWKGVDEAI